MKKIALFIPKLYGGGAERVVSRLSFAFSDYYDTVVLVYNGDDISYECGSQVINLAIGVKRFPLRVIKAILSINRVVKKQKIDLVISFLDVPNLINGIFNISSKKIVSLRAYYSYKMLKTLKEKLIFDMLKMSFNKADLVLTLSERQNTILVNEMNLSKNKIKTVSNPFDIKRIGELSEELMTENDIKFFNDKTSVAIGRLTDQKNYYELLKTFELVLESLPDAKLVILGEGEQNNELKEFCIRRNIDRNVLFAGRVNNPFPYILKSRTYISMSKYEGFPNALVEAMILGVPVLHSDCMTGPREILAMSRLDKIDIDGPIEVEGGILLPVLDDTISSTEEKNRRDICNCWIKLLTNDEYNKYYGIQAKKVASKYDISNVVDEYLRIISELI